MVDIKSTTVSVTDALDIKASKQQRVSAGMIHHVTSCLHLGSLCNSFHGMSMQLLWKTNSKQFQIVPASLIQYVQKKKIVHFIYKMTCRKHLAKAQGGLCWLRKAALWVVCRCETVRGWPLRSESVCHCCWLVQGSTRVSCEMLSHIFIMQFLMWLFKHPSGQ